MSLTERLIREATRRSRMEQFGLMGRHVPPTMRTPVGRYDVLFVPRKPLWALAALILNVTSTVADKSHDISCFTVFCQRSVPTQRCFNGQRVGSVRCTYSHELRKQHHRCRCVRRVACHRSLQQLTSTCYQRHSRESMSCSH